jgi:hypothetical protein
MLLDELRVLETELHSNDTRSNRERMERLLHPDFMEFGRSGVLYTRADVLNEFAARGSALPPIHSEQFRLAILADGVALLTYLSAHVNSDGTLHRRTWRSSIWVHTENGWQMCFHQGTPAASVDHSAP